MLVSNNETLIATVLLSLCYSSYLDIIIDSTVISWLVDTRWMNSLWNIKKMQSFKNLFSNLNGYTESAFQLKARTKRLSREK